MTPTGDLSKAYPRGTFAKVARRLGVTPQAVSLVADGKSTSARIAAELRREQRNAKRREQRSQLVA
jgi:predicted transcriptional regulator